MNEDHARAKADTRPSSDSGWGRYAVQHLSPNGPYGASSAIPPGSSFPLKWGDGTPLGLAVSSGSPPGDTLNVRLDSFGASEVWSGADIGAPAAAGGFTSGASGSFTVRGSGTDAYGTSDKFYYAYRTITGDATIVARVTGIENKNGWSKAGVMIRQSPDANAANVMALVSPTPTNLYRFQARTAAGATTSSASGGNGAVPVWLKLQRVGNTFTASYSANGSTWSALGAATPITMTDPVLVGLAVTSHVDGTLATGTFDSVSIQTPPPGVPPAPNVFDSEAATTVRGGAGPPPSTVPRPCVPDQLTPWASSM